MTLVSSKYDQENDEVININKKSREGWFFLGWWVGVEDKSGFVYMVRQNIQATGNGCGS